jgi:putative PEP-CTERM system histidine kinase
MDMDIFVSRYVVYNSLTLLLVGMYLLAVGVIVHGIRYFNIDFDYFFTTIFIFISIFALAVLLFSARLRKKAKVFITRHFYTQKYEFREKWMEATERISQKKTVGEILKALDEMISETIEPRGLHLWLYDPVSGEYHGDDRVPEPYRSIPRTHWLVERAAALQAPFMIDGSGQEEAGAIAEATGTILSAPMAAGSDIVGFVLLGRDLSGENYSEDDFGFLKALTTQAAVRIRNIMLSDDLLHAREVEAFHRMSSFIMHDLKNLTNSLSLVSQNARDNMDNPEFQKDAIRSIDSTVARMRGLIGKLSEVPGGLDLHKGPVQVKSVVNSALKKLPLNGTKNVAVVNEVDASHCVNVDPDAMDMVFLNLLKNAFDAIGAEGRITVRSVLNNGNIDLTISDNGAGMSKEYVRSSLFRPFKTTKAGGFGIGLFQSKTIVDAHGGKIEVQSTEGRGTTFKVTLPAVAEGRGGP